MHFDSPPDRRGTDSIKWQRYARRDVIPLWVADMDFAAPPAVVAALQARVAHGVFGYGAPWPSLTEAVIAGIARDHNWHIEADWIVWLPGVVTGFNLCCQIAGQSGDEVLTLAPIYPPILQAPGLNERQCVRSEMVLRDGRWQCDWDDLAARISPRTKLLILCQPHNPVGRVFDDAEMRRFAALAEEHNLLICSDEIHCGLVIRPELKHIAMASLGTDIARRTITLMAPSKTWNIPGLGSAFAIISDPAWRTRFKRAMQGVVPHTNVLGLVATEAAYRDGAVWRQGVLHVLHSNAARIEAAVAQMPGISMTPVEATYLAWLDCRELAYDDPVAFFEAAGVGLSDGRDFGAPGFVRLNFACSPQLLDDALQRMHAALRRA